MPSEGALLRADNSLQGRQFNIYVGVCPESMLDGLFYWLESLG